MWLVAVCISQPLEFTSRCEGEQTGSHTEASTQRIVPAVLAAPCLRQSHDPRVQHPHVQLLVLLEELRRSLPVRMDESHARLAYWRASRDRPDTPARSSVLSHRCQAPRCPSEGIPASPRPWSPCKSPRCPPWPCARAPRCGTPSPPSRLSCTRLSRTPAPAKSGARAMENGLSVRGHGPRAALAGPRWHIGKQTQQNMHL